MLLKLLKGLNTKSVQIAGADGYSETEKNYYDSSISNTNKQGNSYNLAVSEALRLLDMPVDFLTPSAYEI